LSNTSNKRAQETFDVFLCHNHNDKPQVKLIGEQLQARGLAPWLDEWELPPGIPWQRLLEEQILQIKSAAVFVGKSGIGPWQHMELEAFLQEFVHRQCPVIPVILADAPKVPELPPFLALNTWVDFREPDQAYALHRLVSGIKGVPPGRWPPK
jgi:TIR domain